MKRGMMVGAVSLWMMSGAWAAKAAPVKAGPVKATRSAARPKQVATPLSEIPLANRVIPTLPVGGQAKAMAELEKEIVAPLRRGALFKGLGIKPIAGVLLTGPPRTGKTLLARTVAEKAGAHVVEIDAPELIGGYRGDSEAALRDLFDEAAKHAPAVVIINEIDVIAGKRDEGGSDDSRMTTQTMSILDKARSKGVIVIGTTNRADALDPAMRQAGRFEREIKVEAPDEAGRLEVLHIHTKEMPLAADVKLHDVAKRTLGMSGGDLESVVHEAGAQAAERILAREAAAEEAAQSPAGRARLKKATDTLALFGIGSQDVTARYHELSKDKAGIATTELAFAEQLAQNIHAVQTHLAKSGLAFEPARDAWGFVHDHGKTKLVFDVRGPRGATQAMEQDWNDNALALVTHADFEHALDKLRPANLREFEAPKKDLSWNDVAGLDDAKEALKDAAVRPITNAAGYKRLGAKAPRGVLMYGPPGTGKTLLAKVVAAEGKMNFMSVKASELFEKWYGNSARNVSAMFDKAKAASPAILFIDEIDALLAHRSSGTYGDQEDVKVVNEFLQQMSGMAEAEGVVIVAATNDPRRIDPAALRAGRIDSLVYVGLPDQKGRQQALAIHTKDKPLGKDVNLADLAKRTDLYSGADLAALCNRAALAALRENEGAKTIERRHFETALAERGPSLSREQLTEFEHAAAVFAKQIAK